MGNSDSSKELKFEAIPLDKLTEEQIENILGKMLTEERTATALRSLLKSMMRSAIRSAIRAK